MRRSLLLIILFFFLVSLVTPRFNWEKAKQEEASTLIASYLKASKAYYTENGAIAKSSRDLGQYITLIGCRQKNPQDCLTNENSSLINRSDVSRNQWYSPKGAFKIMMKTKGKENIFIATPIGSYSKQGFGAAGCFDSVTGNLKLIEMTKKGTKITLPDCSIERANK